MGSFREHPDDLGVEDMISLSDLNEHSILKNLKLRYARELFYTYTGSILVAVNPYKMFNIYGLDMVKRYEGQPLGSLPPHLFAIGSTSYTKMIKDTENQVLVISGESGAGKTESTKLIMQYLAAVNRSGNNLITEQILEANPLLESFGNAKTIRNDNSSRFGKYIEVYFKSGSIVGAKLSEYLLEKSRIVTQAPEERNYHVFYEMLEALTDEQKSKYGLQTAPKYFYLNQGGSSLIPGRDDAENFRKLTAAMDILSFDRQEQDTVTKILASVLHIGNIFFKAIPVNNHDTVELGSDAEIKWISHLLELSDEWLKQALTNKVTEARGDRVVSPYNLDQALDARDAVAKALYCRMFSWLVERVNYIICRAERDKSTSLAVLDIFGFEDFHLNSFEQLCINYANETLQYFFNQHIFQLEQKEYTKEKIRWEHIEFKDNQPTIDLITTKPSGILHILDDECNFPQSTDKSFLEKCHFHHAGNELYDKPRMSDPEFYIVHYAGKIRYNVQHFLEKNKDTLRSDVIELMCESKNKMISQMFKDHRDRLITKTLSKTTGHLVTKRPRTTTVAASFNESLLSLIDTMSRCNPFFVRCIKPNASKAPMVFEEIVVSDQLRYTGMLETIRIRKMGYPVRIKLPHFIERYHCLLKGHIINTGQVPWDVCTLILKTQGPENKQMYQIGATKVFMKEAFEQKLNTEAMKIRRIAATRLQTHVRMFLTRRRHTRQKKSALKIQRMVRMWKARREFQTLRNGIILAQAQYRMHSQRRSYLRDREEIQYRLAEQRTARKKQEVQERADREHRDRQVQMMASVANLDVPGELALVYSKLDEWEFYHSGQHIITAPGDVQPMDMGYKLPVDINSHVFSKYTSVYFKNPNWGVQLEPLKSPITSVHGEVNVSRALAVFKLILRFMCDAHMNEKREKILSDFIVQMALKHEGIRDEILCQLANQTWLNQNAERIERTWRLLANCLCCFNPSPSLFKYLLKYVSDVGQNGYNHVCQHKILQSAYMDPLLSRVYPPTFLEWRAIQRKASMALEVRYPDDVKVTGHVESWTSGELFTSHLLKLRGLSENSQGWTLQLQEDVDYYELMGYDYVLDLVSEIEIAPGFPAGAAYLLVSVDRSKERVHHRRHGHAEGPHNPEKERILLLSGPLPELIKRDIPVTSPSETGLQNLSGSRKNKIIGMEDELGFSMTSVLNQRPTEILPAGLSENSKMNLRYTKRSKAPAVPVTNGHVPNGIGNGNEYADDDDDLDLSDLSKNILNTRYFPNGFNVDTKDLSSSKLNHRYNKKSRQQSRVSAAGVSAQVTRRVSSREEFQSANSDNTDWSHLVEDIFSNALDEHDEQDGRTLGSRIKGGGQGIPGLQTQQPMSQPMGFNYGITTPILGVGQPIMPPLTSPTGLPTVGLVNTGIIGDPLQQITAQHMAQQQAVLQSYLAQQQQQQAQQAVLAQQQAQAIQAQQQQALQVQQQQQALQAQQQQQALQAQQQQAQKVLLAQQQQTSAALKVALQEQELQNKFLKQSIEQETLKQQLRQIQAYQDVTPVVPLPSVVPLPTAVPLSQRVPVVQPVPVMAQYSSLSPSSSFSASNLTMAASSVGLRGNTVTATSVPPPAPLPPAAAPAPPPPPPPVSFVNGIRQTKITSTQPSPLKKVSFIQSQQEDTDQQKPKVPPPTAPKQPRTNLQFQLPKSMNPTSGVIRTLKVTSTSTVDAVPRPPTPPPPVPTNYEHVPPLHTQPLVPPAPPPPPPPAPPAIEIDKDRGTFTIRDRSGRARTVRVGKVVWPPPIERQEKYDIQVGKLEIDETVERNLENRISGKKKWQKPELPDQEETRPKSIIKNNDKTTRSTSVIANSHKETIEKLEKHFTAVSPAVVSPAVPKPLKNFVSESTETENQYALTIEKDEPLPPPIPKSEPPKIFKKTTTETTEILEIKRTSGDYAARIEPDPVKRYEPIAPIQAIQPKEAETQKFQVDYAAFERVMTELYAQNKKFFLMYNKVPWTLHIRKEVFWPSEKLENQMTLHLIYCQIVEDVYNNGCVRISKDQRIKMKGLLEGHGISQQNYLTKELKPQVKKVIVDTAKEWPTYFCRLFPIAASGHYSGVRYLGVSHTGLRLVTRERTIVDDHLSVIEDIRFEDVVSVLLPTSSTVQLNLRTKSLIFQTTRAQQLKDMIDRFCQESDKGNKYVVAVKDYITRESTLLSFKRGDIIKLMEPEMNLERGWMYGSLNGTVGLFPAEYVKSLARHEVETLNNKPVLYQSKMTNGVSVEVTDRVSNGLTNGVNVRDSRSPDDNSDTSQGTVVADGKYSMMEYAMLNFRESLDKRIHHRGAELRNVKRVQSLHRSAVYLIVSPVMFSCATTFLWLNRYEMLRTEDGSIRGTVKMIETAKLQNLNNRERSKQGGAEWTWKEQADLVKWTRSPIQASLLKFNSSDLNKLALECFIAIMRFMGDYPMGPDMTEYDCAKKILKACHKYPLIRDEIFCQLCKQTTNNRSMFSKSKIRGWRLFGLVAAYFDCSDSLRPYLFKYLETAASDSSRTYNNAAGLCLTNLRKTFKYGGRKDVPLREEVVAIADGRTSKRFPFFYSGGDTHEGMLQVKSCTVVHDAIEEVCAGLNITDSVEMEEYTFFIRTRDGAFSKLNREDYLLDETAYYIRRQIQYDLIFQRTVWYFPLRHMDQEIFVDMMFHQCVLDYIEGFIVTLPGNKLTRETASDVAYLGAVLLKANKMVGTPTLKDLDSLVPRNVRQLPDPKPQQWLNRIHENLEAAARMTTLEAKSRFVDVLKRWPLFGSTFFLIKSIPNVGGETMLAVNRQGIAFLRKNSHETFMERPFSEILSTRRYHGDNNVNYLDMKLGDLMVQQILRIETDQGSDISDLIGQYMQVINRHRKLQDRPSPNAH